MKCPNCKRSGMTVMRRCKKCGGIYCRPCADKGVGDYKKTSANVCRFVAHTMQVKLQNDS